MPGRIGAVPRSIEKAQAMPHGMRFHGGCSRRHAALTLSASGLGVNLPAGTAKSLHVHAALQAWCIETFNKARAAEHRQGLNYILSGADTPTRRSAVAMTVRTAPISARRAWVCPASSVMTRSAR